MQLTLTFRSLSLAAALLSAACSTAVGFKDAASRDTAMASFRAGQAQLTCTTLGCLFPWVNARQAATRLVAAQRWDDLAEVVLAANYDQDLGWFYLGLAAAGRSYNGAARTYFDRSIQRTAFGGLQACQAELCDGINLPNDAQVVMAGLQDPVAPRRVVTRARRRPATPVNAAAGWVDPVATPAGPAAGGWVAPVPSTP